MENLAMKSLRKYYEGKSVLVTGHTGFKGSWLSVWLLELGTKVIGYSLGIPTAPSNFEAAQLSRRMTDIRGDIRDKDKLLEVMKTYKPEIIFHLAAQPIVLVSYEKPHETFDINVRGTINILEATRLSSFVKALVVITSDKCYKDQSSIYGYREHDPLGGHDPYSASKAMAELAVQSYQNSFFNQNAGLAAVASVRAGNVIGGGDFAPYRLVPDTLKALLSNKEVEIRNPQSTRPWQDVLVPLSGYLWLAAQLQEKRHSFSGPWNFGPLETKGITAQEVVEMSVNLWGSGSWKHNPIENAKKETGLLRLNWEKASHELNWAPAYTWKEALQAAVEWFKEYGKQRSISSIDIDMYPVCKKQIESYAAKAKSLSLPWAF